MARKKRHTIDIRDGFHVVVMEDMEIWDGADLALMRETLAKLVDAEGRKRIGVEMVSVKYIPSGFFGLLYDYTDRGIRVRLYSPQPHVREMLWFREFFETDDGVAFELKVRAKTSLSHPESASSRAPWANTVPAAAACTDTRVDPASDPMVVVP